MKGSTQEKGLSGAATAQRHLVKYLLFKSMKGPMLEKGFSGAPTAHGLSKIGLLCDVMKESTQEKGRTNVSIVPRPTLDLTLSNVILSNMNLMVAAMVRVMKERVK